MLHTFLDDDPDEARRIAREPLKPYLGTATGLLATWRLRSRRSPRRA